MFASKPGPTTVTEPYRGSWWESTRMAYLGAAAGIFGPACFVGGWAAAAAIRPGYSPVHEAISQLARLGAPNRSLMTAAFIGFGVAVPIFAPFVSRRLGAGRVLTATVALAGLATLGVAAVPLSLRGGGTRDVVHGALATTGYVAMALAPVLGGIALWRRGNLVAAAASGAAGILSAASLSCTVLVADDRGLFQRLGLGVVDAWFAAMAVTMLLGRRREAGQPTD